MSDLSAKLLLLAFTSLPLALCAQGNSPTDDTVFQAREQLVRHDFVIRHPYSLTADEKTLLAVAAVGGESLNEQFKFGLAFAKTAQGQIENAPPAITKMKPSY